MLSFSFGAGGGWGRGQYMGLVLGVHGLCTSSTWLLYCEYMNHVLFSVCSSDSADDALCCKKTADRFVVYRSADILLFLGFYRIFPRLFFLGFVSAGGTGYIPSVTCRCVLVCVNLNSSVCAGSGRSANQYTWKSLKFFSCAAMSDCRDVSHVVQKIGRPNR